MRGVFSGLVMLILLMGTLTLAFNIQPVRASGTIYIRADGSTDPPDAPISTLDNVTYILTGKITSNGNGIVVEKSNIIIDGAGYTVEGTLVGYGFSLYGITNVTIESINIKSFGVGIRLEGSSGNSISENNVANNMVGIRLTGGSSNNYISGNHLTSNNYGIDLGVYSNDNRMIENVFAGCGLLVSISYGNKVEVNTVNDKPLVYLEGVSDFAVEDAGQVILINCNNILVENLNLSNATQGVQLWNTSNTIIADNNIANNQYRGINLQFSSNNNTISGNNITNNYECIEIIFNIESSSDNNISGNNITASNEAGIYLSSSFNNNISGNNITNNRNGIVLYPYSDNNSVSGNNITNNENGILLGASSNYNSISGNSIANNECGIILQGDSNNNTISGNNIANSGVGIRFIDSSNNNVVHHNNFTYNIEQVSVWGRPSINVWDDGYPNGGNYWSDYTGIDANGDGIGDTPYVIDADNLDSYPLTQSWSSLPVHNMNTGLGYVAIQEAINANETLEGHTIFVEAGIYRERVFVNKTIHLIGEGRLVTFVDVYAVDVTANNVTLSGFAIGGFTAFSMGGHGNGVRLEADGCTVDNNMIFNASPYGVWLLNSTNNVISNNVIIANDYNIGLDESSNNTISQNYIGSIELEGYTRLVYEGIELYHSSNNTISQNNVTQCRRAIYIHGSDQKDASNNAVIENNVEYVYFSGGWGIYLEHTSNNTIVENNVTGRSPSGMQRFEGVGISLYGSHFNTIAQNSIEMNEKGLTLSDSHFNSIFQNIATDNMYGLQLSSSSWNLINQNNIANNYFGMLIALNYPGYNDTLKYNSMTGNIYNFGVEGPVLDALDVDATNTVDGRPIYYWVNKQDDQIPSDAGYVAIVNSTNIRVEGLDLRNNYQGILIANSNDITICHNNVTNNRYGILFESSLNNTVSENDVTENSYDGISFVSSRDNFVYRNRIMSPYGTGISLDSSSNNSISQNTISNDTTGISLAYSSDNNTISGSTMTLNYVNVWFIFSSHNTIYHNNFCNYTQQAGFWPDSQENIWDNGYPSGGNYWSDYNGTDFCKGQHQNETGSDGIGDTPYVIDDTNIDQYPFVNPLVIPPTMLVGDLNGDGKVSLTDLQLLASAYNSKPRDPNWNPLADLAAPYEIISLTDLVTIAIHYGQHNS